GGAWPLRRGGRAVRPGRRGGDRDAGAARRDRRRRAGARSRRPHGRMGRDPAARAPAPACRLHHGVPRLGARRPQAQAGGDERAAARDGGNAQFRPVQPRPPHLRGAQARRYRAAVRPAVMRSLVAMRGLDPRIHHKDESSWWIAGSSPAMTRGWTMLGTRTIVAVVFSLAFAAATHAQDWPNRPITLVVPF